MELVISIFVIIASLFLLVKGADLLVNGSSDLAVYYRISPILVGLTVVAFGTSLPEFVVSLTAVLGGSADISIGNIIGSNIANIGLVMAICAMIYPLRVQLTTLKYEFPIMLVASFLFVILANNLYIFNEPTFSIDRFDGVIFLIMFVIFLGYIYKSLKSNRKKKSVKEEFKDEYKHKNPLWKNGFLICTGVVFLFLGGKFFVDGATELARLFSISEAFIGLTIASIGTSLPELFTSGMAAWKKESDISMGNLLGSNIFNILFVVGAISLIKPIEINPLLLYFDAMVMILFTLVLLIFATTRDTVTRKEGYVLFGGYATYIGYLIYML